MLNYAAQNLVNISHASQKKKKTAVISKTVVNQANFNTPPTLIIFLLLSFAYMEAIDIIYYHIPSMDHLRSMPC